MVSVKHFLFAALLATAACAPTPSEPSTDAAQEEVAEPDSPQIAPSSARIIQAGDAASTLVSCVSGAHDVTFWTPSEEDIAAIEPTLMALLEYKLMEHGLSYPDAADVNAAHYFRHYIGITREDRRVILVCGNYERFPAGPVRDGGWGRFQVEYDTFWRQFTQFHFAPTA